MTDTDYERPTDPTDPENDPRDVNRLPPLGEATKAEHSGTVNNFLNLLARKAVDFYTAPCDRADTNLRVLETGKSTIVKENDVIANKIRQDMLSMMAALLRDVVTRKVMPEETGEPPEIVTYLDRQTMSFAPFEVDDQVEADFEQKVIDWYWDAAELDADVWMALFNARTAGWYTAPFEWDWSKGLPRLRTNISVRQVLLDPAAGPLKAVETANWAFLHWRVNWWQARALFPHMAQHLDRLAQDGTEISDPVLQLGLNEQARSTGEKMVQLSFFWHRNYPVKPMTPEEALEYGEIEQRPAANAGLGQSTQGSPLSDDAAQPPQPAIAPVDGNEDPNDGVGDSSGTTGADLAPVQEAGEPMEAAGDVNAGLPALAQYFLPDGDKPITPADPEWPWWLGIRQIGRVQNCIADDRICPFWDIPLLHMPANPLPLSACGQGDPEAMQKIQEGHNRALTNAVEHSELFAHPVQVYCKSAWAVLADTYKQKGASIAGLQVVVEDDIYTKLGGKISVTQPAEPMSVALGQIIDILGAERQDITPAPNVVQGKQTGDVTGWQSTQMLLQQATSKFDLPAMFLQMMVKRLTQFVRHGALWFVPIAKLQQICSDLPPEVVEHLVQRGRDSERNIQVIVNLTSGGAQDRKKAEAVQQFAMIDEQPNSPTFGQRVIGLKTLRSAMGVDNQKEEAEQQAGLMQQQQLAQQQAEQAQQQADQAATMAKANGGGSGNGNGHAQPAGGRMGAA